MADENLIAHCKHQDYVDEIVHCWNPIRVSLIIPSDKYTHMIYIYMSDMYAYALCVHRQHYYY